MLEVKKLVYFDEENNLFWEIEKKKDRAHLERRVKAKAFFLNKEDKKDLDKRFIENLDIIFKDLELPEPIEKFELGNGEEYIVVNIDNKNYILRKGEFIDDEIFLTIKRYLTCIFEHDIEPIKLSFSSFDGGGPSYKLEMKEKGIYTWYSSREYRNPNHDIMCGSAFDVYLYLYPLRPGIATAIIYGHSPICSTDPVKITVTVDDNLSISCTKETIINEKFRP